MLEPSDDVFLVSVVLVKSYERVIFDQSIYDSFISVFEFAYS